MNHQMKNTLGVIHRQELLEKNASVGLMSELKMSKKFSNVLQVKQFFLVEDIFSKRLVIQLGGWIFFYETSDSRNFDHNSCRSNGEEKPWCYVKGMFSGISREDCTIKEWVCENLNYLFIFRIERSLNPHALDRLPLTRSLRKKVRINADSSLNYSAKKSIFSFSLQSHSFE